MVNEKKKKGFFQIEKVKKKKFEEKNQFKTICKLREELKV